MDGLVPLLVFGLCVSNTLQIEGERVKNHSIHVVPEPRTFFGDAVPQKWRDHNGTGPPLSVPAAPSLLLLSNSTASYLQGPLSTQVIPIVYMLTVAVGIPANLAILGSLSAKVRTVSSALLYCSLAVSDLLLLVSLTFKAHYHLHGNHWTLGEPACRLVTACFYGNVYCSALTLACISIQRYLAVVRPFLYKRLPKRACSAGACLAVWASFGAAAAPELLVQQSFRLQPLNRTTCHDVLPLSSDSHAFLLYYYLVLTVLGLLAPLGVAVVCFARIVRELSRSHFDWATYITASCVVLGMFLVCFLPAAALHFLHYVQLLSQQAEQLYEHFNAAVCLCCLHACLDPFFFLLMSKSAGSPVYFKTFKGNTFSFSS